MCCFSALLIAFSANDQLWPTVGKFLVGVGNRRRKPAAKKWWDASASGCGRPITWGYITTREAPGFARTIIVLNARVEAVEARTEAFVQEYTACRMEAMHAQELDRAKRSQVYAKAELVNRMYRRVRG